MRWVLLRGLTREAGHWADFAAALEQRSGAPVVPLDLAGNGSQFASRSPASVDAMAADCIHRASMSTAPVVLVAMSLGAMVALECCRRAPHS
ncbi:MAG: FIG084569: hydrolase, alpha/beta fold family, partial [uncultured Ramlibacter sp.]